MESAPSTDRPEGGPSARSRGAFVRLLLPVLVCALALSPPRPLAAQTSADSVRWRHAMAATVASFLHNEAPRGGLVLESADSTDSRDWSVGFMMDVTHFLDSLKLRTPGDSVQGGKITFSGLTTFEQPYGGIPRQVLQMRMTETTCIGSPGSGRYLSGAVYAVRLFTRGVSLYADINFVETPEGMCS